MPDQDPDKDQQDGVDVNAGRDVTVGGNVVGRDSVTNTTTTTTTTQITEGGPVARYAVLGVVGIAALALIIIAVIASRNNPPPPTPTQPPTATIPAPTLTPSPPPTDTPPPAPTATHPPTMPPTATPVELPSDTPSPTLPATTTPEHPTTTPTNALPPAPTPSPTSALAEYDDFNTNCLDAGRWDLKTEPAGLEAQTPTPLPTLGNCLQAQEQFFTQGGDGNLSVFLSLEGDQTHSLVQNPAACYKDVEVRLALNDMQVFDTSAGHTSYLSVGVSLSRVSGDGFLEVRVEGGNTSGRLASQITSRWTLPGGYINFGPLPYTFRQPLTVAFRVKEVGKGSGNAALGQSKSVTAYVDNQPIGPPFSILADPCSLTIGYHADAPTLLDGYFDEVRLNLAP